MKLKLEGLTKGVQAGGDAVATGLGGIFSLGRGFRDFILKGTVVELAVAVVLGSAFTNLIQSITEDFIVPLIGVIFPSQAGELSFYINSSRFRYGHFITALITFLIVVIVLYVCVVTPLQKLQYAAFRHKALLKDCPFCLEEISMAATRCKHCCGAVPIDEEMRGIMNMAEAAMEAEEQRRGCFGRMFKCCARPQRAVVRRSAAGEAELHDVTVEIPLPDGLATRVSSTSECGSGEVTRKSSRFVSPSQSFSLSGSSSSCEQAAPCGQGQGQTKVL